MGSRRGARTIFTNLLLPTNANGAQFLKAFFFLLFIGLFLEGKDFTKP